jgi:hypothetical protein
MQGQNKFWLSMLYLATSVGTTLGSFYTSHICFGNLHECKKVVQYVTSKTDKLSNLYDIQHRKLKGKNLA